MSMIPKSTIPMTRTLFFLTVCLFASLLSCGKRDNEVTRMTLTFDKEADAFRDTIFFGQVYSILEDNGDIYFTDYQNVRMMRVDKDLSLLNIIGKSQGRGPQDLGYIEFFDVARDTVLVGDIYKQAFVRYTSDGEFVDVVEGSKGRFAANSRYAVDGQNVYFSKVDVEKGTSLAVLNIQTGDYKQFGETVDFGDPQENSILNMADVFVDKDRIICIPSNHIPVIEVYDKSTLRLIGSHNVMHLPQIAALDRAMKDRMSKNDQPGTFSYYVLITNPYLSGDKLYFTVNVYEGDLLYSEILVLDTRDEMKLVRSYSLDEDTFASTICATDKYLYAFVSRSNTIRRYPLKSK
jgi:hypothetical protein